MNNNDTFKLGKYEFTSRFILGSGKYSLALQSRLLSCGMGIALAAAG